MAEILLSVCPTSDERNLSRRTRSGRGHIHLEAEAKLVRQASQSEQIRTICVNAHRPTDWGFVDLVLALWFTVDCTAYECLYIFRREGRGIGRPSCIVGRCGSVAGCGVVVVYNHTRRLDLCVGGRGSGWGVDDRGNFREALRAKGA